MTLFTPIIYFISEYFRKIKENSISKEKIDRVTIGFKTIKKINKQINTKVSLKLLKSNRITVETFAHSFIVFLKISDGLLAI